MGSNTDPTGLDIPPITANGVAPLLSYAELRGRLESDPGVRYWVRDAIRQLEQRDVVDVLGDLELLHMLFSQRFKEASAGTDVAFAAGGSTHA